MTGTTGMLRRSRAALSLAFALALAAGVLVTIGGMLTARARVGSEPAADARFYVVARGPLAEATREGLSFHPEIQILAEHSTDQLLGETSVARGGSDTLRVLEVTVPRRPGEGLAEIAATLQQVDGVVEAIALRAGGRSEERGDGVDGDAAPGRIASAGAALLALGCALFVGGVFLSAAAAVRDHADEIAVRFLLGAEPSTLWRPLGLTLAATALAGALGAIAATAATARVASPDGGGLAGALGSLGGRGGVLLAVAALAFLGGAAGSALLATRRAVGRLTGTPARLLGLALVLAASATSPAHGATVPTDWQVLRGVARELAACRRGLHDAEKALAATELRGIRARARQDAVLLRLATAQRDADARSVERWRESCAALEVKRAELRVAHRASFAPGPPIGPRRPPVAGAVAIGFGEAGRPGKPRTFRNGVGLRTRPGEMIRATAPGKVAYEGELTGVGRVIVVAHGGRTYSIYGRVAETLVMRGMEVEAGEPVARAGGEAGVIYFSVRERGKPVDPVAWLRLDAREASGG